MRTAITLVQETGSTVSALRAVRRRPITAGVITSRTIKRLNIRNHTTETFQPQLGEKLIQKHLAQLLQRIAVVEHLSPLSPEETDGYIRYRLKVAGYSGEELFESQALALIAEPGGS